MLAPGTDPQGGRAGRVIGQGRRILGQRERDLARGTQAVGAALLLDVALARDQVELAFEGADLDPQRGIGRGDVLGARRGGRDLARPGGRRR